MRLCCRGGVRLGTGQRAIYTQPESPLQQYCSSLGYRGVECVWSGGCQCRCRQKCKLKMPMGCERRRRAGICARVSLVASRCGPI